MKKSFIALMGAACCSVAFAGPAEDLKGLLDSNQPKAAYDLGKTQAGALGEPLFDFYFGIAAINAGAPGEGVLALERYLLVAPQNREARFYVARGYYVLGEDQQARADFLALLNGASPAEADAINKYLDAIRARESRYVPTAGFYAEGGIGYDTNINAGVRSGQVAGLPTGVTVPNGATGERIADTYSAFMVGGQGILPVAPGVALYGAAQLNGRYNWGSANDIFDQQGFGLQGGVSILEGRHLFRAGGEYAQISVDNQRYLNVVSAVGEWQYQNNQFNRYGLTLQASHLAYENIQVFGDRTKTASFPSLANVRDSDLFMLSGNWIHTLEHPWNPVLTTVANFGTERNTEQRQDLSRDIYGARVGVTVQPLPRWSVSAGLNYQHSDYHENFSGTNGSRRDDYFLADFSAGYSINRNWSVRGEYGYTSQRSNIGFYQYERHQIAAKVRYEFK